MFVFIKQHYQEMAMLQEDGRRSLGLKQRGEQNRTCVSHATLQQQNVFLLSGNKYFFFFVYVVFSLVSKRLGAGSFSHRRCVNCILSQMNRYTFTEVCFGSYEQLRTKQLKQNRAPLLM